MYSKTDLSILQPFLDVERLAWADVVQFGDDILEMGTVPETADQFRRLLQDLETSPGKPLVFRHTDVSFSPETFGTIRQLLNRHLPAFNAYFGQEILSLQRSVRGRPWEKLSCRDTTGSTPGTNRIGKVNPCLE